MSHYQCDAGAATRRVGDGLHIGGNVVEIDGDYDRPQVAELCDRCGGLLRAAPLCGDHPRDARVAQRAGKRCGAHDAVIAQRLVIPWLRRLLAVADKQDDRRSRLLLCPAVRS